jgi:hypothetical protein
VLAPKTKLYLGIVHANDLEGTQRRISAARDALPNVDFGVATEGGMGGTPLGNVQSILDISKVVSRSYV